MLVLFSYAERKSIMKILTENAQTLKVCFGEGVLGGIASKMLEIPTNILTKILNEISLYQNNPLLVREYLLPSPTNGEGLGIGSFLPLPPYGRG